MAEWNRIYSKFWDSKLRERIGAERHLVETWMWLVYNESSSTVGIYRPNLRRMAADICADGPAAVSGELSRLQELSPSSVRWDPESGYVWIVNAVSYQHDAELKEKDLRTKSKQLEIELSVAAKSPFWAEFLTTYKSHIIGRIATGEVGRKETRDARIAQLPEGWADEAPSEDDVRGGEGPEKGLRRGFEGASKGPQSPSSPYQAKPNQTKPSSFGEEPHARVRESDPTERTPAEDGCPFDDAPHSLDSASHAPPEPDPTPEPVRTTREPHPLAGMGSTRPPPPLVTLTEWQALPLDAKVKHVAHPAGCDAALRDHVQAFDDAAQVLYEHHARAVEDAGLMPRGDGLDAARRAVVYLSAEVPSPVLPSEAAERLMGLVDIAASKPEIVGRPLSGGVPAWVSPDVLFGASASATKFQPTAQRLPDNLNRAKAHAKITDRVRGAQLRVMEAYKPKDLPPGWSEEDAKAVADYVIAKGIAKLRKKEFEVDPSMEAKAVEMEASHAA